MGLINLKPEHVDGATRADLESLGLPLYVLAAIFESGINFKWDAIERRYVAEIAKRRPRIRKKSS
jgi:hypothetical protein